MSFIMKRLAKNSL